MYIYITAFGALDQYLYRSRSFTNYIDSVVRSDNVLNFKGKLGLAPLDKHYWAYSNTWLCLMGIILHIMKQYIYFVYLYISQQRSGKHSTDKWRRVYKLKDNYVQKHCLWGSKSIHVIIIINKQTDKVHD